MRIAPAKTQPVFGSILPRRACPIPTDLTLDEAEDIVYAKRDNYRASANRNLKGGSWSVGWLGFAVAPFGLLYNGTRALTLLGLGMWQTKKWLSNPELTELEAGLAKLRFHDNMVKLASECQGELSCSSFLEDPADRERSTQSLKAELKGLDEKPLCKDMDEYIAHQTRIREIELELSRRRGDRMWEHIF